MTTTENPIMEYLHTILERTDQLLEDVSDLRHRLAKLEQVILEKKSRTPVRTPSKDSKHPIQLNAISEDPDHIQRLAVTLGISEQSALLRIHRLTHAFEQSHGEALTPPEMAEARLLGLID
jgi:cell division septum initiation protein DivIVA